MAADYGHLEIFKFMLGKVSEYADEFGRSPLHHAAQSGQFTMCKFILENMKNQHRKKCDGGITPLEFATENGQEEVCKLLELYEDLPMSLSKRPRLQ